MPTSLLIANEFVRLAKADGQSLTNSRLQKLLYFATGWSVAIRDTDLFAESHLAWKLGPVLRSVWDAFTENGSSPIPVELAQAEADGVTDVPPPSDETKRLLVAVWVAYKHLGETELADLARRERPWAEARGNLPPHARCNTPLLPQLIREQFATAERPAPIRTFEEQFRAREVAATAKRQAGGFDTDRLRELARRPAEVA